MTEEDISEEEFQNEILLLYKYITAYKPTPAFIWMSICIAIIANAAEASSNPNELIEVMIKKLTGLLKND